MVNLREYVLTLEKISELYKVETSKGEIKDSIIENYRKQVSNTESIINVKDSIIDYQRVKYNVLNKENNDLKIKYKSQTKYIFGLGTLIGFISCLLLIK